MAGMGRTTAIIIRAGILVIFLSLLVACGRGKKEPSPNAALFSDGKFHFAIFTNPKRDCIACIDMALKNMEKIVPPHETIPILLKESSEADTFKSYIEKGFPTGTIHIRNRR